MVSGMTAQPEQLIDQAARYQRLMVVGRLCSATLLGMRDTGRAPEGDPELEFELSVDLDGQRRVLRHRQVVSRLAVRELHLGSSLPVRVDPSDPSILLLA
jgi:hypothetical protein